MMFTGEDRQALQTLIDNGNITSHIQHTPKLILIAIQMTIKADEYPWHYHDELVSDLQQKPDEAIHHTYIIQLINNCQFYTSDTKEILKIISL